MKILTIIFNLGLFGIACIGLLTRGSSSQPLNPVFAFLLLLVPILNIVFMLGSRVKYSTPPFSDKIKSSREQTETGKSSSGYMLVKICYLKFSPDSICLPDIRKRISSSLEFHYYLFRAVCDPDTCYQSCNDLTMQGE